MDEDVTPKPSKTHNQSYDHSPGMDLHPLITTTSSDGLPAQTHDTITIHHASASIDEPYSPYTPATENSPPQPSTADKAGVILGIHNVFLVLPQFIVTFLSSIIFYLMEPSRELPGHHPQSIPVTPVNGTNAETISEITRLVVREGALSGDASSPDAVGLIFR